MKLFKKAVAVALAAAIVAQGAVSAFSLAQVDTTADYYGEVLAAINTDYSNSTETFTASCPDAQSDEDSSEIEAAGVPEGAFVDKIVNDLGRFRRLQLWQRSFQKASGAQAA